MPQSQIRLWRDPVAPATNYGSSLLAVNATTLNGGFIQDADYKIGLDEVLPSGGYNLLPGDFEGDGYQPDPMDMDDAATLRALDRHYGAPLCHGGEIQRLVCPY